MAILKNSIKNSYRNALVANQMFEHNVHLGNKTTYANPRMHEFIYGISQTKNCLFNLDLVIALTRRALAFLTLVKQNNGIILFVSTGPHFREIVKFIGTTLNQPYVNMRWFQGLLTNWENMSSLIKLYRLFLSKLDQSKKKKRKMADSLGGLSKLTELPSAIFLLDLKTDSNIISEAKRLNIPVVALVDNDHDIESIDYPIPINTTSILSVLFFLKLLIAKLERLK